MRNEREEKQKREAEEKEREEKEAGRREARFDLFCFNLYLCRKVNCKYIAYFHLKAPETSGHVFESKIEI